MSFFASKAIADGIVAEAPEVEDQTDGEPAAAAAAEEGATGERERERRNGNEEREWLELGGGSLLMRWGGSEEFAGSPLCAGEDELTMVHCKSFPAPSPRGKPCISDYMIQSLGIHRSYG